ncbi:MAG: glycosyltransferase family 2 protein [Patescibacteria group bacterium]|nr:glycosyltransferase family 2 protein [Patescibacteria group bacterium]
MKLSIVIPAFNEEKYIGDCLEATIKAMAGFPEEVEIIVINNASTDRTHDVAAGYSQVKVFDEPKKGTNSARQLGLVKSSGDLIANIDADNKINVEWLKTVFQEFSANPRLVALSGPYLFYDLTPLSRFFAKLYYWLAYPVYVISNKFFKRGGAVMGGNVVIRKSALEAIGGYNTALTFYGDDTDTAVRLSKVGLVKFNYHFTVQSSGRRLANEGLMRAGWRYVTNHFSTIFFKKPYDTVKHDLKDKCAEVLAKIKE